MKEEIKNPKLLCNISRKVYERNGIETIIDSDGRL